LPQSQAFQQKCSKTRINDDFLSFQWSRSPYKAKIKSNQIKSNSDENHKNEPYRSESHSSIFNLFHNDNHVLKHHKTRFRVFNLSTSIPIFSAISFLEITHKLK
jgi:hypothetical protein